MEQRGLSGLIVAALLAGALGIVPLTQAATPTCVHFDFNSNDINDGYKCSNDDGDWWINYGETVNGDWEPVTVRSDGARVGPGYISRGYHRGTGRSVVDDRLPPADSYEDGELNDPHYGGLLAFGYHAATTDTPGGPKSIEPLFKTSVDNRRDGSDCVNQVTCYGGYRQLQDFAAKVYRNFFSISLDVGWTL